MAAITDRAPEARPVHTKEEVRVLESSPGRCCIGRDLGEVPAAPHIRPTHIEAPLLPVAPLAPRPGGALVVLGAGLLEQPLGEPIHAALGRGLRGAPVVGSLVPGAPDLRGSECRHVLEREQLLPVANQGRAQGGARLANRAVQDLLERAVLAEQLDGGLLADTLRARDAV